MALTTSIGTGGTNSRATTAEEANALATDILTAGVIGSTTSTSGVAPMTGGFAVNAQGTPDTTVAVSTGVLYTTATPTGGNSQKVRTKNSASSNVTIAANASGGTRFDWLYLKIDPDKLANSNSGGTDIATLVTSRSSSATTDNGTPPTYGTLLAIITVANGFSTITNGNITDKRTNATSGISAATSFFALNDFVESGCVWTADAAGSTLAASMTTGYVWISGVRLTVPAVAARAFTASKDTYVDLSDNGDGTAAINYTEATNNAASPALSAGRVRVAIVVSGATNIAAAASINQGDPAATLPVASNVTYQVTDSLGNLIYPKDSSRRTMGYRQYVTQQTGITTETALTGISVPVIVPAGGLKLKFTIGGEHFSTVAGDFYTLTIKEDGSAIAVFQGPYISSSGQQQFQGTLISLRTAGSHTYTVTLARGSGSGTISTFVTNEKTRLIVERA